jgi:hypothetical protein
MPPGRFWPACMSGSAGGWRRCPGHDGWPRLAIMGGEPAVLVELLRSGWLHLLPGSPACALLAHRAWLAEPPCHCGSALGGTGARRPWPAYDVPDVATIRGLSQGWQNLLSTASAVVRAGRGCSGASRSKRLQAPPGGCTVLSQSECIVLLVSHGVGHRQR